MTLFENDLDLMHYRGLLQRQIAERELLDTLSNFCCAFIFSTLAFLLLSEWVGL